MSLKTILFIILAGSILNGCGEPASKWDDKRGRFVSTDQLNEEARQDRKDVERRLDNLERARKE